LEYGIALQNLIPLGHQKITITSTVNVKLLTPNGQNPKTKHKSSHSFPVTIPMRFIDHTIRLLRLILPSHLNSSLIFWAAIAFVCGVVALLYVAGLFFYG
jgi:hypothetical protein